MAFLQRLQEAGKHEVSLNGWKLHAHTSRTAKETFPPPVDPYCTI